MANRYWVGGSGTWNATATTNWAATSGGAGGQTAPTADDSVFIDAASGLTTGLTITTSNSVGALVINNLTITPNAAVGSAILALGGPLTVTGTFSTSGTAGNKRFRIQSDTFGLVQSFIVNSFSNVSDIDFRDIYFCGSPNPLSGTRIGDLRNNTGITFSTPKTVYWNLTGAQNWSATAWALTSGGVVNTENFPLAQDTAKFDNTGAATTVTIDAAIPYIGTIDFSSRTTAVALVCSLTPTIYGSWILGSGVTLSGTGTLTFSGDSQTITSAGKTFTQAITIDSVVGGTVTLGDSLIGTAAAGLTITRGIFKTVGFNITIPGIASNNSNFRTIDLSGPTSSIINLNGTNGILFTTSTNLTFIPGTSTVNLSTTNSGTSQFGSLTWYNVNFTANRITTAITGAATFNNLSFAQTSGICAVTLANDITITGRLTTTSTNATTRTFISSSVIGTPRTITATAVSLSDCDFLDIIGAGSANWSGTRLGNCGGNTGISFPIAKTVYWNLAGAQNWTAVAWCTNNTNDNGVTLEAPNVNNFPLPQDTAKFNEVGTITGTITISNDWNLGTLDTSARSVTAATLSCGTQSPKIYGNFTLGTAVTFSSSALVFQGRGTQTIITNGRTFTSQLWLNNGTGTTQLGDALNMSATTLSGFNHLSGTFNAVTFNITHTGQFNSSSSLTRTLYMGTGTWTTSYSASCWLIGTTGLTFYKGTANMVFSDTTNNSSRSFTGGTGLAYNKITIGGAAATGQTFTLGASTEAPTYGELASTKTVAWTLALGPTGIITLGAWTITGTVGNIVTVSGTATLFIAGPRIQNVNYLQLGTTLLSTTSPGEFYAGPNSTNSTSTFTLTAAPASRVLYWRGNGGTWDASTTTNWALTSGAASGGQAPPTSVDTVNINAASGTGIITFSGAQLRCGILNITGGTFALSGTAPLAIHGSITLPASGLTMSNSGGFLLSGTGAKTINSSGTSFSSNYVQINGIGSTWTLASNMTINQDFAMTNGSFNTAGFTFTVNRLYAVLGTYNTTSLSFGSSIINLNGGSPVLDFTISSATGFAPNQTFDAGTSTINISCVGTNNIYLGGKTFYNVNFTNAGSTPSGITIYGQNTFRSLSLAASTTTNITNYFIFAANQTITTTLTASGTAANRRTWLRSDTIGTPRTLTVGSFSPVDCDFRDITISGVSVTGTRLGNCGGNTGITFDAGKTVYWNLAGAQNWSATAWCTNTANDNGATLDAPSVNSFPLAQDTAKFNTVGTVSGTITIERDWNIGTIDMSARGAGATMTLATGTTIPAIYGNWINGAGLTLSGTGIITFAGRGTQTITSAGKTFTQPITINSGSGTVALGDALTISATNFILTSGTFNSANYNVQAVSFNSSGSITRTLSMGSSTWTLTSSTTVWTCTTSTNLTVNKGTSNIILSDATSGGGRTFAGGGLSYNKLTIGGTSVAGTTQTVTFTGNNSFGEITTTKTAPLTINLTTTIQTIGIWSANGGPTYRVSINGTNGINPATLIVQDPNLVKFSYCNLNSIKMQNKAYFTRANSITYIQGFNLLKNTSSLSSTGQLTTNYNGQISEISINPSYSVFFNGTTNYLNITGTMPTIGTGDFTIEGWFYFTSLAATTQLFDGSPNGGGVAPLSPIVNTNGTVLSFYSNGAYRITGTTTLVTNTWYHVACCRVSGTTRIFLNGMQQGISYSDSTSYASTANSFFIGRNASAANSYMSGYISNFRVISGVTGLYSADFTVPTASLTAIIGTSLLTAKYTTIIDGTSTYTIASNSSLPTAYFYPEFYSVNSTNLISENIDGTITADVFDDYTISPISGGLARKVYSDGTYQTSGAIDEFSNIDTFSANFTGTNYLTVSTDPSLTTSDTGDWTLEAWLYPTLSSASTMRLWKIVGGVENSDLITSTGVLSYTNGAGSVITTSTATGLVPVNVWTHVAFVKRSGTLTIYTGGVARATQSPATGTNDFTNSLQIGTGDAGLNFTGYMSNFRYVKGVAVYTGTFTPPTYNLQAIQSAGTNISAITGTATSLLTCQGSRIADFSTRKLKITNTLSVAMLNSIPGPF